MARAKRLNEMRPKAPDARPIADIVAELRSGQPVSDYREQSLRIHGLICARCGREFEGKDRRCGHVRGSAARQGSVRAAAGRKRSRTVVASPGGTPRWEEQRG